MKIIKTIISILSFSALLSGCTGSFEFTVQKNGEVIYHKKEMIGADDVKIYIRNNNDLDSSRKY